ncbi:MAG: MATE family efflux transporter [Desulfovibrio sp.]|jgi:MATE family multidrug resistance protein|nr:MATE family efflux transporter [Desulfovibrio sp.]
MALLALFRRRWTEPHGYAEILRVGLPLVAGMASSTVMQFTDRLFLSRYSVDAIAAALPASLASLSLTIALMGVCGYTSVLIAQYVGSGVLHRVGCALWQGIWIAIIGAVLLGLAWWIAKPGFAWVGHDRVVQELEVVYFRVLTAGGGAALLGATLSGFFSGLGLTRPVMIANTAAAVINIPLDYLLIFGGLGVPPLGVLGAGLATVAGWLVALAILGYLIFIDENEKRYAVFSGYRFEWSMFRRLLRYGLPSGLNFFMEIAGFAWFCFEIGRFGKEAQAASNIAFSVNSVIFLPMLGLNLTVSSLVGQAMGRGRPNEAERVTLNTLHMALTYMLPFAALIAACAGPLMDVFISNDLTDAQLALVREQGMIFLYFIAVYSLVDAANIVYFGALKGAGDTLGILYVLFGGMVFLLILPIAALKWLDAATVTHYWLVFTLYVMLLAVAVMFRYYRRAWHSIRVVETSAGTISNTTRSPVE